jgi:hypothetical protein
MERHISKLHARVDTPRRNIYMIYVPGVDSSFTISK